MATFSSLQSRYKELKNYENEYWGNLREALDGIVTRVAELLAIPDRRNLRLGVFKESGEFDAMGASVIPEKFRSLEFSLLLVLDETKHVSPPSTLRTNWAISREQGNVMLSKNTGKAVVESYDHAATLIISEFRQALEDSDPSKRHDFS